jgi:hypothetical protein
MVDGYRGMEYEERLKSIGLTTLGMRREGGLVRGV